MSSEYTRELLFHSRLLMKAAKVLNSEVKPNTRIFIGTQARTHARTHILRSADIHHRQFYGRMNTGSYKCTREISQIDA